MMATLLEESDEVMRFVFLVSAMYNIECTIYSIQCVIHCMFIHFDIRFDLTHIVN